MTQLLEDSKNSSALKRALFALKDMRGKLDAIEQAQREPIAIIGIGCRFPGGANNPEAFWQLLHTGSDAIREVPASRWDVDAYYDPDPDTPGKMYTRQAGLIDQVDQFDTQFFGISPREALSLDPQQRLLLEVSWEALEYAGLAPDKLVGSQTGVFIGISANDYTHMQTKRDDLNHIDAYVGTGGTFSVAAGRISYILGLNGPALAVDTACSSSLVAVHLACQSLRSGQSNLALAGGVSLILSPDASVYMAKAKALAPDGRCKTFDENADGYGRGEGCGVIVLKRLSNALADGDNILAVIRGSAINHDGRSSGLTVPNGSAQQNVIRAALADAGDVAPHEVNYVEAHGTGTPLGDPIEVRALAAALGKGRPNDQKLAIGSVKTNIGHLEAASGIAGLLKLVLAFQYQEIPRHLHVQELTSHVDWDSLSVKVVTESTPWLKGDNRRLAGVSSFGFSGTNAHVLLEEAPTRDTKQPETERSLHILSLSARNDTALKSSVERLHNYLSSSSQASLADIAFTLNCGRTHFFHRLAVIGESTMEIRDKLAAMMEGQKPIGVIGGDDSKLGQPKIAFLFTGQGAQYADMGRQLYQSQPIYRAVLDRCDELLRPYLEHSLLSVLFTKENGALINETAYTQPALFALEYALAQLWLSWGIKPSGVMGHSVGEYVAACVAGVFSLEDGLKLIAARGRLMQALPQNGTMAVILTSEERVTTAIAPFKGQVSIAAVNGPENIVISGLNTAIQSIVNTLQEEGVKTRPLTVSHAFHSPLMEPMLDAFEEVAASITYVKPRISLISNLTGQVAGEEEIGQPSYWRQHVRQKVQFQAAMKTLNEQGYGIFLEIGPNPTLLSMGQRCLPNNSGLWLSSLRKGRDDWQNILNSLASLYVEGIEIDWEGFDRAYVRQRIPLPTYPFQRQRYWVAETTPTTPSSVQTAEPTANPIQVDVNEWLYKVNWREEALKEKAEANSADAGSWLILADAGGVGDHLAHRLQELGEECLLVRPLGHSTTNGTGKYLDPADPTEYLMLLRETLGTASLPLRGVVHLWALDIPELTQKDAVTLETAHLLGTGTALHLVKAITNVWAEFQSGSARDLPRLWVVTRAAQAVAEPSSTPISVMQSMVWGFGKTIALEHAKLWGGLIDLDPNPTTNEIMSLLAEIRGNKGEGQVAFRDEQRYVARLISTALPSLSFDPGLIRADGAYLISGGLGGLGLEVARWLATWGARRLILLGRTPLPPRNQWKQLPSEDPLFHKVELMRRIELLGTSVYTEAVDVGDEDQLSNFISRYQEEAWPPIRGVIHAAGVIQDTALTNMDLEAIKSVVQPKVMGAWLLHHYLQEAPLDFFILFSSVASVGGSAGQGNYAAANAFLDALAAYRHRQGQPALSVNWGPWAKVGMAAHAHLEEQRARRGIDSIEPEIGLTVLGQLMKQDSTQIVVMPATPGQLRNMYPVDYPLLAELEAETQEAGASAAVQQAVREQILTAPTSERLGLVRKHLQQLVSNILLMEPTELSSNHNLMELGMDSIMIMELIQTLDRDLKLPLQAREIFERPSIEDLSTYLLGELETGYGSKEGKEAPELSKLSKAMAQLIKRSENPLAKPDQKNPGIVFLLSGPRSGSTLLRVMLAGHSSLFCPPELHLLPFNTMAEHRTALEQSYLNEGLQRAIMELMNLDAEQSKTFLTQWAEQALPVQQAYQQLQELAGPRLLVDKSPSYAVDVEILNQAEILFDKAKYIYLVRHPYAMIDSFIRRRMDKIFDMGEVDSLSLAEYVWTVTNQNILNFLTQVDPQRHHRIYYEELVSHPRQAMEQLCQFLEIPFDQNLLTPYLGDRMTDGVHAQSISIGDPHFLKHNQIDPALGEVWRSIQLPRLLDESTQQIAAQLNYELPLETKAEAPAELHTEAPQIQPVPRTQDLPLSFAQQRLWFLNQLAPNSPGYNMPTGAFRLSGTLNIPVLEQSLNEIVRRHEILRTTFPLQDDQLVQVISAPEKITLPIISFDDVPEPDRETSAHQWAVEEIKKPFDLANGPLFRPVLLRLSDTEHLLLLTMHHIISDGWSIGVTLDEITTLYQAFLAQEPSPLPEPSIHYADYAAWQQEWLQGQVLEKQLAYWKNQLDGAPEALMLPTDYPRPTHHSFQGARSFITMPKSLSQAVNALSRQHSTTPFMIMLTALKITLFNWTGQQDMVLGTVIANRTRAETKNMLGCFMNFLPLRTLIYPEETGIELLGQIKSTFVEAYNYQDCPFEKLVDATTRRRSFNQNPLYNVAFLLQNMPRRPLFGQDVKTDFIPYDIQASLLDLRLVAQETDEGLSLWCEYNTDLFASSTIEHLLDAYQHTLETFIQSPHEQISKSRIPEALVRQAQSAKQRDQKPKIAISATFTAEPIENALSFWSQQLHLERDIEFAPYNQVFQELLNPNSLLSTNEYGINVILLRFEDWLRYERSNGLKADVSTTATATIEQNVQDLIAALKSATQQNTTPYLICVCPVSPAVHENDQLITFYHQMEELLATKLETVSNAYLIRPKDLFKAYPIETYYDPDGDELGHIPYTMPFFVALGTLITRTIHAISSPPRKVIVLDCDRTLWSGICGEEGALGVSIDPPFKSLQAFMVEQYEAGMLICLCSKNVEDDVWAVFDANPDMILKRKHLTAWKINWQPKSENIRTLADELQLGLDSFIFIDDNPVECAEVQAAYPEVLTLQLPEEVETIPKFLNNIWAFDHLKITKEDKERTTMYRQNVQREQFRKDSLNFHDFLAGLNLEVQISEMVPQQLARVSQLTQRTNQFNLSTLRRSESEIELFWQAENTECLVVEVNDRFGQYGLVGAMLTEADFNKKTLKVDTFLLSCRVLGRGVEHLMLAKLGEMANGMGLKYVDVIYQPTPKNQPAFDFMENVGSEFKQQCDSGYIYRLTAEYASNLTLRQTNL